MKQRGAAVPTLAYRHRMAGLGLVEIMVALAISLVLMAGVYKIYIASKQSYRVQTNLSRLQEDARLSLAFLNRDIRMAGYAGCANPQQLIVNVIANNPPTNSVLSASGAILGYSGSGTWPANFPSKPSNLVSGTDALYVQYAMPSNITVSNPMSSPTAQVMISSNPLGFQAGQVLVVTDCTNADVFRATNVANSTTATNGVNIAHSNSQNAANFFSKAYDSSAQVMAYQYRLYYIGTNANGVPALYREDMAVGSNAQQEELVDDVKDMAVRYGVDTDDDGSANEYMTATQVDSANEWQQVVSVRLSLLLETPDNYLVAKNQVYTFDGTSSTAPDRRMYSVVGDTITLRNRIR